MKWIFKKKGKLSLSMFIILSRFQFVFQLTKEVYFDLHDSF